MATRLEGTVAVSCVALPKVVARAAEFHCTTALAMKPVPLTVSVKPAWPAVAVSGLSVVITGVGTGEIVKGSPFDTPPVSLTVTVAPPAVAVRLAATVALNWVALTKVVGRGTLPAVPAHCTTAALSKFVPMTVSDNAGPPATAVFGLIEVIVGGAGEIVKGRPLDVPLSLDTVTVTDPGIAIRLESTDAVTTVSLTGVLGRADVPHSTTSLPSKLVPVTVSVKLDPPAVAEAGLRELIVGACPAAFVGTAKITAAATHNAAVRDWFRRPPDSRCFPDRCTFSLPLLLVRLDIKGPKSEPGLSTSSGAGV